MKRILLIFGTRPEAIKMAPVIRELKKHPEQFETLICVTAQHREMLDQVLKIFDIRADYDLDIMRPGQDLYDVTASVLLGSRGVLAQARPDMVLVHGDTTTTMAATLAAFYARISVGHVEAGLRTGNKSAPFPEEVNRRVTGTISDLHFAPTNHARQNLLAEGIPDGSIHVTGNTVIDALFLALEKIKAENLEEKIVRGLIDQYPRLRRLFCLTSSTLNSDSKIQYTDGQRIILVTGHRRENFGEGFKNICFALREITRANPDVEIIYPVHLNPNVQKPVHCILSECPAVHLVEPQDYLPFVYLMDRSCMIITDSGGVQEEAPSLGKPVLVMRDTTERPEAVEAGTVKLVGTSIEKIVEVANSLLQCRDISEKMSLKHNPYGDGKASTRIVNVIDEVLNR